ncbi:MULTISPECIES: dipeptide/oligopeptide/nickel ABC transporter permease/ATP-binding protein [Rhodococcus]|uniref:Peptide ABC transporter ATP-binding protein n=1 Tax=Rhodococcus opacus TaxID=37919 RepID=A0A2S8IHH0_RHOOP|nr:MULTISPECIES: dipeptide/oligopeptide/nickel ABC transporter permease/ATP-binding protein [Rhodococcus]MDI9979952.1 dipeptide/oligopeptide/nickel ABC transporter permease/ATP-binding protein [Rhodococcus sp. IEGM 1307]PQP14210.1 peptide ABC transporter ATP-binding protein [Rhodococcus opacus]
MSIAEVDSTALNKAASSDSPSFVRRLLRHKLAAVCIAYLFVLVGIAIVAPIALPDIAEQNAGSLDAVLSPPSLDHLLGTDQLGRDVLDRLLVGTRTTLVGVGIAVLVVLAVGVPLGLAAGYFGGWVDRAVTWVSDLLFGLPGIVVVLLVLAVFPYSMVAAMTTFGVLVSPAMMRVVRVSVLPIERELYIAAARAAGLSRPYIIVRHVVPRVSGAIIVQTSVLAGLSLITQCGLCFLGLLVKAPEPSWGGMVADGVQMIIQSPWLIWPPGVLITVTVLVLGLLGDVSRDALTAAWAAPLRSRRRLPVAAAADSDSTVAVDTGAVLTVRGLKVGFQSHGGAETRVVDGVNFDIAPGETVGLVGESGCGKSATAMSIVGLLPGTGQVEAGSIFFGGRDLTTLSDSELNQVRGRDIAVISQEPMVSFNPTLRIGWQLAEIVRRHHHVSRAEARSRVLDLLAQVHLPDPAAVAASYPHELSGGMAQRVAIARALAGDPSLVIADEPTTALDVTVQAEILGLLRELQANRGMAILLITHDWGVVAEMCQRAVVLYAGQVIEQGPIIPVFQEPRHPYTKGLLMANPHGVPSTAALPAISGTVPPPGQWPSGCRFNDRCAYATAACGESAIPLMSVGTRREARCIHSFMLEGESA